MAASGARYPSAPARKAALHFMISSNEKSFPVGKYLVSPLSRLTETGDYSASISLRSGRGMGTHDRVFRLVPRFATHHAALRYAAREGRALALQHCAA